MQKESRRLLASALTILPHLPNYGAPTGTCRPMAPASISNHLLHAAAVSSECTQVGASPRTESRFLGGRSEPSLQREPDILSLTRQ